MSCSKRYTHADPELISHYVRVLPIGVKSFLTVAPTSPARLEFPIHPNEYTYRLQVR